MFAFMPLSLPLRIALLILPPLWVIAYVRAVLARAPHSDGADRLRLPDKLVMIGVTLAVGLAWLIGGAGRAGLPPVLIFAGLVAGAGGDLILADAFRLKEPVIPGMLVFGIGHLFYMGAILLLIGDAATSLPVFALSVILSSAGWWILVRDHGGDRKLNIGSLLYGTLLFGAAGLGIALAVESKGTFTLLALGLSLFAASDILLAQGLIRHIHFRNQHVLIWLLYSAGQMLIAYAIGLIPSAPAV